MLFIASTVTAVAAKSSKETSPTANRQAAYPNESSGSATSSTSTSPAALCLSATAIHSFDSATCSPIHCVAADVPSRPPIIRCSTTTMRSTAATCHKSPSTVPSSKSTISTLSIASSHSSPKKIRLSQVP